MRTFLMCCCVAFLISTASFADDLNKGDKQVLRIGIIGLDTSHAVHFTKTINSDTPLPQFSGCRIVAAYPHGSADIESSVSRIPGYTEEVQKYGVEIVDSIPALLEKVDAVLLETNDGRPHLEQVIPVLKAGKPVFVDKPVAASLVDAIAIYKAAEILNVPLFTSSSLRFTTGAQEIKAGAIGEILGCDTFSPCPIEATHPDLFWYGIHGVEPLFTLMGPGCETVTRVHTESCDVVVGTWSDGRIGTFRGRRGKDGKYMGGYGGTAFGTKGTRPIGSFSGYEPLLSEIIKFFKSGDTPIDPQETLEIYAFMQAADASRQQDGKTVSLKQVMDDASSKAKEILKEKYDLE